MLVAVNASNCRLPGRELTKIPLAFAEGLSGDFNQGLNTSKILEIPEMGLD